MATQVLQDVHAPVREVISRLRLPVLDVSTLLSLLTGPLDCLGLLPPKFRRYNTNPLPDGVLIPAKSIPTLQQAVLEHVVPTWHDVLVEEDAISIVEQYFCPDAFSFASPAAGEVTSLAYSSILSLPLTDYSVHLLVRLTREYPIDRLHAAVFSSRIQGTPRKSITWEDCIRSVVTVPTKVANFLGGKKSEVPLLLEHATYFNNLSLRCECLIFSLSCDPSTDHVSSVIALLTRLVHLGVFPSTPPTSRSQPSFFEITLPTIRTRFLAQGHDSYSAYWSNLILSLPSAFTLQAILASLFSSLSQLSFGLDPLPTQRALVKREASLLRRLVGPLIVENEELWECVAGLLLSRDWSVGHGRIFACWVSGCDKDDVDSEALASLLSRVVDMWSSPEHIKHSLLGRHRYITSLLLITASYLPPSSPEHESLALSPAFISGVGMYIGHLDNSVRHCGILVAEVVAQRAGKKLDFGEWEGDDSGKPWARELRDLIKARDVDATVDVLEPKNIPGDGGEQRTADAAAAQPKQSESESASALIEPASANDSDDSLTGYASPASSRSASPTPSDLDEIEKDPTLAVGVKKIPRPVYLAQLGEMVRSTGGLKAKDASQEADKIEMALNCADELIRKKRNYGTELEENAVNLVYGFIGLQDNYDLEDFEAKRQRAVNALVVCCPRKTAPSLIEEFFKNQYSTNQRFVILNALVLGARELVSLPLPPSAIPPARTSFPSKTLPVEQHKKYIAAGNQDNVIQRMLDNISRDVIEGVKSDEADKVPELVRERRLRIRKPAKVTELTPTAVSAAITKPRSPTETTFTEVAAEFFIAPLINRFWLFLRDEQTREERTAHQETLHQYRGAGTGLILNPLVLAQFLASLALLVHAARNAPEWLAVAAPDALELAITLGTRPLSQQQQQQQQQDSEDHAVDGEETETKNKEVSVLTAALELALVVLDGCLELDGGRSIGLDHTALLLGTGEWAGRVFSLLEKGERLPGGGAQDSKVRRAAAGVLLKVDALTSTWRRSMINIT